MRETVGGYKILEWVGLAAGGEVFRARDRIHGRTVTLRVIASEIADDPGVKARFVADAKAASGLSHPNIAMTYEIGEDDDLLFIATEFVPGQTLSQAIAGHGLNPRHAVDYAIQIADALAEAHADGLTHGGLAATNVVVTAKGTLKLLDFGLAGWIGSGARHQQQDDLQSLAHVIFEMITGKRLREATKSRSLTAFNRDVPRQLDAIVDRLRVEDQDRKYGSAATVAAELRAVAEAMDQPSNARPSIAARESRSTAVNWAVIALTAVAIAVAIAWLAVRR